MKKISIPQKIRSNFRKTSPKVHSKERWEKYVEEGERYFWSAHSLIAKFVLENWQHRDYIFQVWESEYFYQKLRWKTHWDDRRKNIIRVNSGRDNKRKYNGSGGSNRNKIRVPSMKRSSYTWRRFLDLFPRYRGPRPEHSKNYIPQKHETNKY